MLDLGTVHEYLSCGIFCVVHGFLCCVVHDVMESKESLSIQAVDALSEWIGGATCSAHPTLFTGALRSLSTKLFVVLITALASSSLTSSGFSPQDSLLETASI